jgi:hypothetical protein
VLEIDTQALHSPGKHLAISVFKSLQELACGPGAGGCRPVGSAKSSLLCRELSAKRQSRLLSRLTGLAARDRTEVLLFAVFLIAKKNQIEEYQFDISEISN